MKKPTSVYLNAYKHTRTAQFVETALGDRGTLNGFINYIEEQAYDLFNQTAEPSEPNRTWLEWKARHTQSGYAFVVGQLDIRFKDESEKERSDDDYQAESEIWKRYFRSDYPENFKVAKLGLPWDSSHPAWSHLLALFYATDFGVIRKYFEESVDTDPQGNYWSIETKASSVTFWSDLDFARQTTEFNLFQKTPKFALLERGELTIKPVDSWDRPVSLYLDDEQHKLFQKIYSQKALKAIEDILFQRFTEKPKMNMSIRSDGLNHSYYFRRLTHSIDDVSGFRYTDSLWTSLVAKFLQFKDRITEAEGVTWNAELIRAVCEQILQYDYDEQTKLGSLGDFPKDAEDDYEIDEDGNEALVTRLSPLIFPDDLTALVNRCREFAILPASWELALNENVLNSASDTPSPFALLTQKLQQKFGRDLNGDPRKTFEEIIFFDSDFPEPTYRDALEYHTCELFALYADSLYGTEGISINHLVALANDGTGADPLGPARFLELASGLNVRVEGDGQHVFYKGKTRVKAFTALQSMRAAAVLGVAIERFNDLGDIGKELKIEIGMPILEQAANSAIEGVWDWRGIRRAAQALALFPEKPIEKLTATDKDNKKLADTKHILFSVLARSPNLSIRIAAIDLITQYCLEPRNQSLAIFESEDKIYVAVGAAQALKRLKPAVQRTAKAWEVEERETGIIARTIVQQAKDRALWLEVHPAQAEIEETQP